ncbi:MAG: hypothetical protein PHE09_11435 [Oscillospiraceae bacterium]|nr:hypothetical protein [Oscillospiraceae bacterium]
MSKWRNVTESFSEEQRHYKNTYLEIDEVYDEMVEVSLFSSKTDSYEIYISYGRMYGIVYVPPEDAVSRREEIKNVLAEEYEKKNEPTSEFINKFAEKYHLQLPVDIFF